MKKWIAAAGVLGFAMGIVVGRAGVAPPPVAPEPLDFTRPVEVTFTPAPVGAGGTYTPHYVVVDGKGERVGPHPDEPAAFQRKLTLAGGRVVIHLRPD